MSPERRAELQLELEEATGHRSGGDELRAAELEDGARELGSALDRAEQLGRRARALEERLDRALELCRRIRAARV